MCQVSSAFAVSSFLGAGREAQSGRSSCLASDGFGNYRVIASSGDDLIRAFEEGPESGGCEGSGEATRWLWVEVNQDRYRIPLNGRLAARSVAIDGGPGQDMVWVDPNVRFPIFIQGGAGDDSLKGGGGPSALMGGPGNDILIGGRSGDLLLGGDGRDVIHTGGGHDMVSMGDLLQRLQEGWCKRPPVAAYLKPETPPATVQPQPQSILAPVPQPIVRPQLPPVRPSLAQPPRRPFKWPRPHLSDLLAAVETHDEKGFKSGRSMTKDLLTALYEGPGRFQEALKSIVGAGERDDAVASFLRALLDSGPAGARLFQDIPLTEKKTLASYLGSGNCWNAQKKALLVVLSKATGVWNRNFEDDAEVQDYVRRYTGVV